MGTDMSTSFSVSPAGNYKLCYRANGEADSVEQNDIILTVQAAATCSVHLFTQQGTCQNLITYPLPACQPVTSGSSACPWEADMLLPFLLNALFWHFVTHHPSTGEIRLILVSLMLIKLILS
jgi:hypothetical protein